MVGLAPRHYTGFPGAQLDHMNFEFWGNCSALGAVLGTGGQASQIHSESAQTLRIRTDIALVQLLAHIAITQPCTHYASQLKYCKHCCIHQASHLHSRAHQASQVHSESAQMLRIHSYVHQASQYTEVHAKHPKYTASQLKYCECTATLL